VVTIPEKRCLKSAGRLASTTCPETTVVIDPGNYYPDERVAVSTGIESGMMESGMGRAADRASGHQGFQQNIYAGAFARYRQA